MRRTGVTDFRLPHSFSLTAVVTIARNRGTVPRSWGCLPCLTRITRPTQPVNKPLPHRPGATPHSPADRQSCLLSNSPPCSGGQCPRRNSPCRPPLPEPHSPPHSSLGSVIIVRSALPSSLRGEDGGEERGRRGNAVETNASWSSEARVAAALQDVAPSLSPVVRAHTSSPARILALPRFQLGTGERG